MLKLKLQYFGHLMWRTDSLKKMLMLGKIEGRGGRHPLGWVASPTQWPWVWVSSGSCWWTGKPGMLQSMESQTVGHEWAAELNDVGGNSVTWPHPPPREAGRCRLLVCPATPFTSVTQMSPLQKERGPLLGVHLPWISSCARSFVSIDISFVNSVW